MSVEFYIYVALLVWIIAEVRDTRREVVKAQALAAEAKAEVERLRTELSCAADAPEPLFPYVAPLPLPK